MSSSGGRELMNKSTIDHGYGEAFEGVLAEAESFESSGDYGQAEGIYASIIDRNPSLPYAFARRGYAREKQRNFQGAAEDYSVAIAMKPMSPITTWRRAIVFEHLDMLEEAKADYFRYLDMKGPDADTFFNLSMIYSYQGEAALALEYCQRAVAASPDNEQFSGRLEVLLARD